jgi:hypothetical protein
LVDVFGGDRVECLRDFGVKGGRVGADLLPGAAAIARAEDELVGVVESFVGERKDLGKGPGFTVGIVRVGWREFATGGRGEVQGLIAALVAAALEEVALFGVGDDGIAFTREAGGFPVAEAECTHA